MVSYLGSDQHESQLGHYAHTMRQFWTNDQFIKYLSFAILEVCHFTCHILVWVDMKDEAKYEGNEFHNPKFPISPRSFY